MHLRRVIFLIATFLLAMANGMGGAWAGTRATRYLIDGWQTDQGLPQNSVISIAQTRDGYLWLATFNGLVRFDGARFAVFDSHNTPELESSRIVRLWEDASGALWIGTESGAVLRREGAKFERIAMPDQTLSHLNYICDGEHPGEIWFTRSDGRLFHFGEKLEAIAVQWESEATGVTAVFRDLNSHLMLLAYKGMMHRDGAGFVPLTADSAKYPNNGDLLTRSISGGCWRSCEARLQKFQDDKIVADRGPLSAFKAPVVALYEDQATNLWVGTSGSGAYRIDAAGNVEAIGDDYGLGHAHVSCFLEDREGNMWLGTDGAGLHRLRVGAFSVFDKAQGLADEVALAVVERDDGIWIGTNGGGVTRLNENGAETFNTEGMAHVWTLLSDRKNNLWVGAWGGGAFRERDRKFQMVPELNGLNNIVLAAHEDPSGTLWFGGQSGLASWREGKVHHFTRADGLSHDDVRGIIDDGDGGLWIATNGGGLNRFKEGRFSAIRRADGLADDAVWTLYRDADDRLWVGTFGGGISALYKNKITNYTLQDGLPSGVICSITEDDAGQLWMSSYSGVFRAKKQDFLDYKPGAGRKIDCHLFTKSDGLPSRECTGSFQPSACKTRDGRLIFPTVKGIAIIDPRKLKQNPLPPKVLIEEAEIDRINFPLEGVKKFSIPAGSEQVEFRYTGLSFCAPEKVRFRYRLEGLDKEWQDPGSRRTAYYSHLPPGDYEFQVMASNNDGVWNRTGATLPVHVVPAFWQTLSFQIAFVLLAGGCLAGMVRFVEVRKLHRRMELLEQQHAVERERARIAKDIHDDLGASLTQITLLSELARTDLASPPQAESHIRQISGTARELTRAMDEIVWAVNPENDTLEDLLTYTVKFAQEHLGLARIRCRVDAPAQLPPLHLSAEVRHNLFLAVKEAINNVAKHSHATEAWLRLRVAEKQFAIEIEDNGQGLPAAILNGHPENLATPGSHNGLRNMECRLLDIGGSFEAHPRPGGGTIIRLRVEVRSKEKSGA